MEGLLKNDTNIHAGIRTTLSGMSDYENDGYVGFEIVEAREIDTIGTAGIIKKIHDRVGECSDECWEPDAMLMLFQARTLPCTCRSTLTRSTRHSPLPLELQRLADGLLARSAQSFVVSRASTWRRLIL